MTSSASKKRRRRREREKRTQELLQRARAISLVDVASPPPKGLSNPVESQTLTAVNGGITSNDKPTFSSANLPQEPSWKRVEFVLPRADGKKPFVFDRQLKEDQNSKPLMPQETNDDDEKLKNYKKFETIEDILFAGKRKKESVPPKNGNDSRDNHDGSGQKAKSHDKNEPIISEAKRQKLEDAFEAAQQSENKMDVENFVHVNGSEKTSSPDEKPKAILKSKESENDSNEDSKRKARTTSFDLPPSSPGQISGRTVKEAVRDKRGLRPRANSTDGELNLPRGGLCDERMILEAHKWNTSKKFTTKGPPRGLHNLGNTCFLNATLQCLAYLPPFSQTLITLSNNKMGRDHNGGKRKMPQGQKITSSLCNLFQQAHGLNNGSSKSGGPFAPKRVVGHLPNIGSCGSRNGYKFRLGRQEDAHEFLVHLLDAINDGELRAAGINQNVSGWRDRLPVSRLDETTFVHRIFGGYFRSQIRCRRCNYKSNTYDPFLDLSLEVSKKSSTSVLKALAEFTRKETLDADNQWKCSGCKKYVCATKQLTVFRPPLSLCIQLKRFAFDSFGFGHKFSKFGGFGGGGGGSKITKSIEFPGSLKLPLSDNRSCQYTLTGVVIHVGGSSQSGHYTAYVKKPGKNGTSQWYHMDDSHVEPVSEKTVLRQRDAYLLFYCRTEVKLEFPDPPTKSMSASEATEFGRTRAIARAKSLPSESMKKELMEQGFGRTVVEDAKAASANRNLFDTKEESAPSNNKEKKRLSVETEVNPIFSPPPGVKTNGNLIGTKKSEEGDESSASSSSSDSDALTNGEGKDRQSQTKANDDSDASSDDSSYHGSSANSSSSSDSDSSSQIDSPPSIASKKKSITLKSKEGSSSESESEVETKPAFTNGRKNHTKNSKQTKESSESDTSESDSDSSEDGSSSDEETEAKSNSQASSAEGSARSAVGTASKRPQQQMVQNNTDSRGKVKVMLGSRKRKVWESVASTLPSKGSNFHLLGNRKVSQWDDDDDNDDGNTKDTQSTKRKRENIVETIDKQNRKRKRKMHLDRWDSHLDQGRQKKVKSKSNENPHETSSKAPKKNIFQRIQSGVQKMNRGKPKGTFRRFKNRKGSF